MRIFRGEMGGIAGIILIGAIFVSTSPSRSAEIAMERYRYENEMPIRFSEQETFMICDCPAPASLALMPVMPPIVLKVSAANEPAREHSASTLLEAFQTTLTFDFDSDRLSPSEKEKLEEVITKIKNLAGKPHIQILGYTSDIGPAAYNRELSMRRAEEVADLFRSSKLVLEVVAGKGSCCPVSKTRSPNRRVEIIIQEGERP